MVFVDEFNAAKLSSTFLYSEVPSRTVSDECYRIMCLNDLIWISANNCQCQAFSALTEPLVSPRRMRRNILRRIARLDIETDLSDFTLRLNRRITHRNGACGLEHMKQPSYNRLGHLH